MRQLPITASALFVLLAACSSPPATPTHLTPALAATGVNNLAVPRTGLLTAGQPTEEQLTALAGLGVKRVICLRPATEPGTGWEEDKAKALGITFVRLPIGGAPDVTPANARRLGDEIAAAGDATTLVCCGSSNRVGALLALHAFAVENKSADESLAFGRSAGLKSLEPVVVERLKADAPTAAAQPAPAPQPATATAVKPKDLKSAMKGIEDDWKHIEELLDADPATDLPGIAKAAVRIAGVMRLGYDTFEDKEVPKFATYAREAEAAFVDLAAKATAGNADAIRALKATLQPQHCARCHDAVEEVHG